ncbi:FAD-linked oxidase C-terminal domain-containing protein [Actinomadura chokoriensis]|uniref:FAD-linked oxidase C-terminal domain-containing protein n=1 Tax=Actinomadura chokoriensis TaxID=454156 RepID=A0ABV4QPD6_9ACTN
MGDVILVGLGRRRRRGHGRGAGGADRPGGRAAARGRTGRPRTSGDRRAGRATAAGGGARATGRPLLRDHRPWYDRQRPAPFAAALRAVKSTLDPAAILNPGVLIDPGRKPASD